MYPRRLALWPTSDEGQRSALRNEGTIDLEAAETDLSSKLSLCSDLSSDKDDLTSEDGERVDHLVDGVRQAQHLSLHSNPDDFLGEISLSNGGSGFSDRSDL
jgi:hypothetical protein